MELAANCAALVVLVALSFSAGVWIARGDLQARYSIARNALWDIANRYEWPADKARQQAQDTLARLCE